MPNPTLDVQRIYVKRASVETPNTPNIFTSKGKPTEEVRIDKSHNVLENEANHHEVVLDIAITAKIDEEILSITKVQQAGIFKVESATGEQLDQILQTECLNILYPHAMQKASDLSVWSTYRPIVMRPMNFCSVYNQLKEQEKKKEEGTKPN